MAQAELRDKIAPDLPLYYTASNYCSCILPYNTLCHEENYILQKLQKISAERNWTYYKLAKESYMPLSIIRNIFRTPYNPSISTLSRICDGLGITLAQFFSEKDNYMDLSSEQIELLNIYDRLTSLQKEMVLSYAKGISSSE